jgi:hypothetical protein
LEPALLAHGRLSPLAPVLGSHRVGGVAAGFTERAEITG